MPLHLLGKKSWNVYNTENIARVRQDEAAAKAQEEQEERKWREDDAERRLQLLRGESPDPTIDKRSNDALTSRHRSNGRKHRRVAGEDDTDRDIRLAREQVADSLDHASSKLDTRNHEPKKDVKSGEQVEVQGMRFRDAAGTRSGSDKPWYTTSAVEDSHLQESVSRDVWGNEDPRRREREQNRMSTNDPLLVMKRGVKKLRDNEKERKAWLREREKDLHEVEQLAKRGRKRKHRREDDGDSLDGFSLDRDDQSSDLRDSTQTRARHKHRHSHNSRRREGHHSHNQRSRED